MLILSLRRPQKFMPLSYECKLISSIDTENDSFSRGSDSIVSCDNLKIDREKKVYVSGYCMFRVELAAPGLCLSVLYICSISLCYLLPCMLLVPLSMKGLLCKHYSLCHTLSARSRNNNVTTAVLFEGYNSHTTVNQTKLVFL